jgi:hypothetical protein
MTDPKFEREAANPLRESLLSTSTLPADETISVEMSLRGRPPSLGELLATAAALSPIGATIPLTQQLTGNSRSEVYRLLVTGKLCAIKRGTRTFILWESVSAYLTSLPAAVFGNPNKPRVQSELPLDPASDGQEQSNVRSDP